MTLPGPTTTRLSVPDDILAAAKKIAPILRNAAAAEDKAGRLSDEVVDALHGTGVFGMLVPRVLGGGEVDPVTSLSVIQELTYNNASAGWNALAGSLEGGMCGAFLGDDAVKEMFGGDRFPVVAGQGGFSRPDTARTVEGGFLISGDYSFASGVQHAQWVYTQTIDEKTKEMRICVTPVDAVELKPGSWDVLGLRATGSLDYSVRDVFVPQAFSHALLVETPERGGALYTVGLTGLVMNVHQGWALGIARRLLDELKDLAHAKAGRVGSLAESARFHASFGLLEAKYAAARAYVLETWRDISNTLDAGHRIDMEQKTHMRLALYHVTRVAAEISNEVFAVSGTQAIWPTDIQRYFRDAHTGDQHGTSGPAVPEGAGKVLAGFAPDHDWAYLSVIPKDQMPPV